MNFQKRLLRILIVDDMAAIHDDFRKVLIRQSDSTFEQTKNLIFADVADVQVDDTKAKFALQEFPHYQIDSAYQGQEALAMIQKACAAGEPYALAFVDIRMPPGWDGIETIKQIWQVDKQIQIVICTAYSDYSLENMYHELGDSENYLILKKPFDPVEIFQLALALTRKWEYKQQLLNQIDLLETTVHERTLDLVKAKEAAEQANTAKNEFLRNMSHELRTPLTGIYGFAQIMANRKLNADQQKEFLDVIISNSNHITQMINDMFYLATIETGEFAIEPNPQNIDLKALILNVKKMFDSQMDEKQLQFNIDIDSTLTNKISVDPELLTKVLYHLLSNAIKFSFDNGNITIHASPIGNEQFQIEVTDTGIGISKEDVSKLFTKMQQLDTGRGKQYEGIGLGLVLVRHVIEAQGGKVGFKNNNGQGSTFYIELPMHEKSEPREKATQPT